MYGDWWGIVTYDVKVRPVTYTVGDLVWRNQKRNAPSLKSKIVRHWTGPWVIVEKLSDITFKIKWSNNSPPVTVHGDILKKYKGNKIMKWFIGNEAEKTTIRVIKNRVRIVIFIYNNFRVVTPTFFKIHRSLWFIATEHTFM
jgi:hypothetical protein